MLAPTSIDLKGLFTDPDMFESNRRWRRAGFDVDGEGGKSDIMVASHPAAKGYLFKKYSPRISLEDQLDNYSRRIDGAEKLAALVAAKQLTRIVVPGKHLHELPREFSDEDVPSYVLVVERIALLRSSRSKQLYRQIDEETLRQLCVVLRKFPGLGSGVRNVPFTHRGQIAFVDTERWEEEKEVPLRRIREYLSHDRRRFAEALL